MMPDGFSELGPWSSKRGATALACDRLSRQDGVRAGRASGRHSPETGVALVTLGRNVRLGVRGEQSDHRRRGTIEGRSSNRIGSP